MYESANKRRILVADTDEGMITIRNVFSSDATLMHVTTIPQALAAMTTNINMVLCGIHFDECRMFDLLRFVKADVRHRSIPFLCYRDLDSALSRTILEGLEIACKALGASSFIDVYELKRTNGLARADDAFRRLVFTSLVSQE